MCALDQCDVFSVPPLSDLYMDAWSDLVTDVLRVTQRCLIREEAAETACALRRIRQTNLQAALAQRRTCAPFSCARGAIQRAPCFPYRIGLFTQ